jgi:hypothetical protein
MAAQRILLTSEGGGTNPGAVDGEELDSELLG